MKKKKYLSHLKPELEATSALLIRVLLQVKSNRMALSHFTVKLLSLESNLLGLLGRLKNNGCVSTKQCIRLHTLYMHERDFCEAACNISKIIEMTSASTAETLLLAKDGVSVMTVSSFRNRCTISFGINVANLGKEDYETRFGRTIVGADLPEDIPVFDVNTPFHSIVKAVRCCGGLKLGNIFSRKI